MTSQAESKEPLKNVFSVIMPEYLFEIIGLGKNLINLTKEKYNINDK